MEQRIKARYTGEVILEARRRYGIRQDQIHLLDAYESFIYEFERDDGNFILRLGHSLRRSEAMILGEVDWINYLAAGGVPVARAVPSESGKLVEAVPDGQGGQFLATAFVKAQGRPLYEVQNPSLYAAFGRLLGGLHARTEHYQPADPAWRRPAWDDSLMDYAERYLPATEHVAKQKYRELSAHLRTLPSDSRSYGLIHFDAHGGNCLVDSAGRLTLIDFDDCTYSWYANDIAIALGIFAMDPAHTPARTHEFMANLLRGYQQVYRFDSQWLRELPVFLKMGEIFQYAVVHRDYEDPKEIDDPWMAHFMQDRKYRIEHDAPTIDFDFESLYRYL
jgi:Ser/Thr protein kinase RdoA (MazF antagonist)